MQTQIVAHEIRRCRECRGLYPATATGWSAKPQTLIDWHFAEGAEIPCNGSQMPPLPLEMQTTLLPERAPFA